MEKKKLMGYDKPIKPIKLKKPIKVKVVEGAKYEEIQWEIIEASKGAKKTNRLISELVMYLRTIELNQEETDYLLEMAKVLSDTIKTRNRIKE